MNRQWQQRHTLDWLWSFFISLSGWSYICSSVHWWNNALSMVGIVTSEPFGHSRSKRPLCLPLDCEDFPGLSFTGMSTGICFSMVWTPCLVFLWCIRTSSMPYSIVGTSSSAQHWAMRCRNCLLCWNGVWRYQTECCEWGLHITSISCHLTNGHIFPDVLECCWVLLSEVQMIISCHTSKDMHTCSCNSKINRWLKPYVSLH